jgi:lipopolysaccharide/colanic/teichoic acid biosynthesis glycosyltransferase
MLLIALFIMMDSHGSPIFRQRRYGFNNQEIEVLKFRTMSEDTSDETGERQTAQNDPRVTRVGRFLRRTSLDELPQLFNVLSGEMSLVGPRPHATATKVENQALENVVINYASRHRVKPGMTGWAQVNGWRGQMDSAQKLQERIRFDLYYIENWSILLDLRILFKTIIIVLKDRHAF